MGARLKALEEEKIARQAEEKKAALEKKAKEEEEKKAALEKKAKEEEEKKAALEKKAKEEEAPAVPNSSNFSPTQATVGAQQTVEAMAAISLGPMNTSSTDH